MGSLGISLYPEKSELQADKDYLQMAQKYGFSRVFMNLLLFQPKDVEAIVSRLNETIAYGNDLGFETFIDVNPYTLKALEIEPTDLGYFAQMGVAGIRLDMGFTGKEEAEMTKNKYGLLIEINMSNDDHYLARIFDYNPRREKLVGCHNFFPQAYTGLDMDFFIHCSNKFTKRGLRTAAFVTSQVGEIGPWPLHEGLCTIEEHRALPIKSQVKHLKALQAVDDIIIGNAYASEDELREMSDAFFSEEWIFTVEPFGEPSDIECEIIEEHPHFYRGDRSAYMIRSSGPRLTYFKKSIPAHHQGEEIKRGDVLLLNEDYAQYKGEVQIALKDRPADFRVNKIGHIVEEEQILLNAIPTHTAFRLQFTK